MLSSPRRAPLLLAGLVAATAACAVAATAAAAALTPSGPTLHGVVQWPASEVSPAAISVTLTPHGASTAPPLTTVPAASDGGFTFTGLPTGSHLLEVTAPGLAYYPVWVWVRESSGGGEESSGGGGETVDGETPSSSPPFTVEAAYADAPARLLPTSPLTLRPAARTSPFDARAAFDPVAFAKTPYGLLLLFVAFAVFALPRLRIDPEEYEELMAEQRARRAGGGGGGGGGARRVEGRGEETAAVSSGRRAAIAPPGGGGGGAQQRRGGQ